MSVFFGNSKISQFLHVGVCMVQLFCNQP